MDGKGLLRYDQLVRIGQRSTLEEEPDRTIAGVAYWFPHQGTVSTVLLLD